MNITCNELKMCSVKVICQSELHWINGTHVYSDYMYAICCKIENRLENIHLQNAIIPIIFFLSYTDRQKLAYKIIFFKYHSILFEKWGTNLNPETLIYCSLEIFIMMIFYGNRCQLSNSCSTNIFRIDSNIFPSFETNLQLSY